MILTISAAMLGAVGAGSSEEAQPSPGFIICPGDRRCPPGLAPPAPLCPPGAVSEANGVCVAAAVPSPAWTLCPDGLRVLQGHPCPLVLPPPQVVYFGWDAADLSDAARSTLNQFVESYRRGGVRSVVVGGHSDRSGTNEYNVGLSHRRARAVQDYLIAMGIPAGSVRVEAYGESRPAVETEDGLREPQNRRVEILTSPDSGW